MSGGQRQRLMLARALVRDAPVMLLDEATSNIDVATEGEVLDELFARTAGRTVVFVTHRVATASRADHVLLLDAGRLRATGSHLELLATNAMYARMVGATATFADEARPVRQRRSPELNVVRR